MDITSAFKWLKFIFSRKGAINKPYVWSYQCFFNETMPLGTGKYGWKIINSSSLLLENENFGTLVMFKNYFRNWRSDLTTFKKRVVSTCFLAFFQLQRMRAPKTSKWSKLICSVRIGKKSFSAFPCWSSTKIMLPFSDDTCDSFSCFKVFFYIDVRVDNKTSALTFSVCLTTNWCTSYT